MTKRKMFPRISDLRKIRVREVIEVERIIGEGIDSDPARRIQEYYDFDGKLLARRDAINENEVVPPLPDPPEPSIEIKHD